MLLVIAMPRIGELYQSIKGEDETFYNAYHQLVKQEYDKIMGATQG